MQHELEDARRVVKEFGDPGYNSVLGERLHNGHYDAWGIWKDPYSGRLDPNAIKDRYYPTGPGSSSGS